MNLSVELSTATTATTKPLFEHGSFHFGEKRMKLTHWLRLHPHHRVFETPWPVFVLWKTRQRFRVHIIVQYTKALEYTDTLRGRHNSHLPLGL